MPSKQHPPLRFRSRSDRISSALRLITVKRWRWIAPAALLSGALFLQAVAGIYPAIVERYYSRAIYPRVANGVSFVGRHIPFSLAEVLIATLLVVLVGAALWQAYLLGVRRVTWRALLFSCLRKLLWAVGGGAMLFLLTWGLNYQRPPLAETMGMQRGQVTTDELQEVGPALVAEINRSYSEAGTFGRDGGINHSSFNRPQIVESIVRTMRQENFLPVSQSLKFVPPKPIYFSRVATRLGLTGVFTPFTGEPNFNAEQPAFDLPFTMAHEMAHQRGFAREDEANFVAFVVCVKSEHPYVRYSGYLHSLSVLGVLARERPARYSELMKTLDAGPRADLQERSRFWRRHLGRSSALGNRVNNFYLKANRVKAGVSSYNDSATLIVRYYLSLRRREAA